MAIFAQPGKVGKLPAHARAQRSHGFFGRFMASPAQDFLMPALKWKAGTTVVEGNSAPACNLVAVFTPAFCNILIHFPAMRIAMAIPAAGGSIGKTIHFQHGTAVLLAVSASSMTGNAGNGEMPALQGEFALPVRLQ